MTIRAALCRAYGPPEAVVIGDIERQALAEGEVRIRVREAAVNFPDVLIVAGDYQIKVPPPFVPGSELAGEVIEVAEGVTSLVVGDLVFGSTLVGAFAQQAVVPAAAMTRVPAGVALDVAAAFGVAHRTAFHMLRSVARVQPGEELVVLGAGGGVGLAAVQLGAILGATVTAVASSEEKRSAAVPFGATRTIDPAAGDLREALRERMPGGTDVIVDPVGGELAEPALRSLRWGGRFVTVGYASGVIPRIPLNLVLLKGAQILGFQFLDFAKNAPDEMERNDRELRAFLADGRAFPHIGARFGLEDTAEALRFVADGRAVGKVVLDLR